MCCPGSEKVREHFKVFQEVGKFGVLGTASMHRCGSCYSVIFCRNFWEDRITSHFLCYCRWNCCCFHFHLLVIWLYPAIWETSQNCKWSFKGKVISHVVILVWVGTFSLSICCFLASTRQIFLLAGINHNYEENPNITIVQFTKCFVHCMV